MNRTEIENKIAFILSVGFTTYQDHKGIYIDKFEHKKVRKDLTDLFITLSNERCEEQKRICAHTYATIYDSDKLIAKSVLEFLNAPLPELH